MGGKTHNCEFTPKMSALFGLRDKEMKDGSLQEEAKRCGVSSKGQRKGELQGLTAVRHAHRALDTAYKKWGENPGSDEHREAVDKALVVVKHSVAAYNAVKQKYAKSSRKRSSIWWESAAE